MVTFSELSKKYAQRIRSAITNDGFNRLQEVSTSKFRSSGTFDVLKEIRNEINNLVYEENQKPLSDSDKKRIYEDISQELRLPRYKPLSEQAIVKAASNDDLTDLIDAINDIVQG